MVRKFYRQHGLESPLVPELFVAAELLGSPNFQELSLGNSAAIKSAP